MKINSPWVIGSNGSAAGLTFQQQRGLTTARQKPTTVRNPRTDGQVLQRQRTAAFAVIARAFKTIVAFGFKNLSKGRTALSQFQSVNVQTVTDGSTIDNVVVDYFALKVAEGSTLGVKFNGSPTYTTGTGAVTVSYMDAPGLGGNANDIVTVIVFDKTENVIRGVNRDETRSTGSLGFTIANGLNAANLHVYMFVSAADGTPSDSVNTIFA